MVFNDTKMYVIKEMDKIITNIKIACTERVRADYARELFAQNICYGVTFETSQLLHFEFNEYKISHTNANRQQQRKIENKMQNIPNFLVMNFSKSFPENFNEKPQNSNRTT